MAIKKVKRPNWWENKRNELFGLLKDPKVSVAIAAQQILGVQFTVGRLGYLYTYLRQHGGRIAFLESMSTTVGGFDATANTSDSDTISFDVNAVAQRLCVSTVKVVAEDLNIPMVVLTKFINKQGGVVKFLQHHGCIRKRGTPGMRQHPKASEFFNTFSPLEVATLLSTCSMMELARQIGTTYTAVTTYVTRQGGIDKFLSDHGLSKITSPSLQKYDWDNRIDELKEVLDNRTVAEAVIKLGGDEKTKTNLQYWLMENYGGVVKFRRKYGLRNAREIGHQGPRGPISTTHVAPATSEYTPAPQCESMPEVVIHPTTLPIALTFAVVDGGIWREYNNESLTTVIATLNRILQTPTITPIKMDANRHNYYLGGVPLIMPTVFVLATIKYLKAELVNTPIRLQALKIGDVCWETNID